MIDELDVYVKGCLWESLENRKAKIETYHNHINHVCGLLPQFVSNVSFAILNGKSKSMVSHLTYSLVFDLISIIKCLYEYEMLSSHYLLADDYDFDQKKWDEFRLGAIEVNKVIDNLESENYFNEKEDDDIKNDFFLYYLKYNKPIKSLLNLERHVSILNGDGLLNTLRYHLSIIENWLNRIKTSQYEIYDDDFETIYMANYNLYKRLYWPSEGANFRRHIENYYFRGKKSRIEILENQLIDEQANFEKDSIGALWRDYIDDKKSLYFEMKRAEINIEQWKYFFKYICRFEEYEKWIYELEHPNVPEKVYPLSDWDEIFKKAIDVAKIKIIIPYLLSDDLSKPNLFVLHKVLNEIDWLHNPKATTFLLWIKDVYQLEKCPKDFKSIDSRLKEDHTLDWDINTMTSGAISKSYIDLAGKIRKEFVEELDGKVVVQDNKNYFIKQDLYIEHKQKL